MNRVCIYTKDIQIITGKSDKHCRAIITKIKKLHNKEKHQSISIEEFCNYQGLNADEVRKTIK
jgi:ribosomal silencing factor RsfS